MKGTAHADAAPLRSLRLWGNQYEAVIPVGWNVVQLHRQTHRAVLVGVLPPSADGRPVITVWSLPCPANIDRHTLLGFPLRMADGHLVGYIGVPIGTAMKLPKTFKF